jgi:hypothetical protein
VFPANVHFLEAMLKFPEKIHESPITSKMDWHPTRCRREAALVPSTAWRGRETTMVPSALGKIGSSVTLVNSWNQLISLEFKSFQPSIFFIIVHSPGVELRCLRHLRDCDNDKTAFCVLGSFLRLTIAV